MIYHSTAPHCAESDINNEAVNIRMTAGKTGTSNERHNEKNAPVSANKAPSAAMTHAQSDVHGNNAAA